MGWMNTALFGCLCSPCKDDPTAAPEQRRSGNSGEAVAVIAADVPEMTMSQLNQATAKFSASRLIGRGAYAEVFRATLPGGRAAAAKRLIRRAPPPGATPVADVAGTLRHHVAVASWLRHENVVRLLGYNITAAGLPVLLYELAGAGTLHDALHGPRQTPEAEETAAIARPPPLSWEQRARIALDAAAGLAYLHEEAAVTHGDVRSTNVLLFEDLRAKIADNNVFKLLEPDTQGITIVLEGSPGYHPPDYVCTGIITRKSDVFSFGVVLLELLTGRLPVDATLPRDQQILMEWAIPFLTEGRVEECIDPKLGDQYPAAGALKLGRIAVLCLQDPESSRPSMDTVARLINCNVIMRDQHGGV